LEGIVVSCQAANDSKRALFALKDERNAFPGRSDTYRVLAALQTKMDLGDEAIATLKDLATRQPEFVAGLKDLAKLHTERKEWEEALAVWTRIVDKEPTKDSCLELARLHQELGQTAQAARNFFRALCLDGTDPRAFAGLGISHQLGNQPSKAYLLMGRALALGITANRLQERYVECRKILQDRRLGLKKVAS
jgi:Flp pilus assembly protein TadD